jgi:hypothetical protein
MVRSSAHLCSDVRLSLRRDTRCFIPYGAVSRNDFIFFLICWMLILRGYCCLCSTYYQAECHCCGLRLKISPRKLHSNNVFSIPLSSNHYTTTGTRINVIGIVIVHTRENMGRCLSSHESMSLRQTVHVRSRAFHSRVAISRGATDSRDPNPSPSYCNPP